MAVCLALGLGCQRKAEEPTQNAEQKTPTPTERILARVHCKGFAHLAAGTNASTLQEIWKLPETETLRSMALEKLTPALLNVLVNANAPTNSNNAALLRPLLDDLLRSESVFEMVQRGDRPPVWTLALRLDEARKDLWRENTAKLLQGGGAFLFSGKLTNGWIALARDSTTVDSTLPTNTPLWREVGSLPATVPESPHWLRADADWPRLTNAIPACSWLALPKFDLTVQGKDDGLRTEVHLHFAKPLNWPIEPWQLPTNTIRDPLISFTALRGFGPWVKTRDWFQKLGLASLPNQLVAWGQSDTPFQIQLAAPVGDATNELKRIAASWVPLVNSNLVDTPIEPVQVHTNVAQINTRMLFLVPFIRVAPEPAGQFLNAGIFPVQPGPKVPPAELFEQLNRTNLVYYDWEITQFRLGQLRETLDLLGTLLTLPQMGTNSVARRWVDAAAPKLGNTITELSATSSEELSLVRRSHIGLNGLELVALANWIESTNFPKIDLSVGFRPPPKTRRMQGAAPGPPPPKL